MLTVVAGALNPMSVRRRLAAAIVLAVLLPSSASAMTIVDAWGHQRVQPWQSWTDRSAIPLPADTVMVNFAACPSTVVASYGCMADGQVFVDPASPSSERRRLELHEIGHWLDAHYLTVGDREAFRRVARAAGGPWLTDHEGATAGEQFAEAFSLCSIHRTWNPDKMTFWLIYWKPTPARHSRVCAWMRTLATRWT